MNLWHFYKDLEIGILEMKQKDFTTLFTKSLVSKFNRGKSLDKIVWAALQGTNTSKLEKDYLLSKASGIENYSMRQLEKGQAIDLSHFDKTNLALYSIEDGDKGFSTITSVLLSIFDSMDLEGREIDRSFTLPCGNGNSVREIVFEFDESIGDVLFSLSKVLDVDLQTIHENIDFNRMDVRFEIV